MQDSMANYSHHDVHHIPMTYGITGSLYLLTPSTHFAHPPPSASASGNHQSVLCVYELFWRAMLFVCFQNTILS